MKPNYPLVIASILNWNAYESTIRCVQMVESLPYPNKQIVIVDNHSTDESIKHIRAVLPHIRLLQSPVNNGYASGHRLAVEYACRERAELIWLLNTDIDFATPAVLDKLVEAYQAYPGAIYGSLNVQSGTEGNPRNRYFAPLEHGFEAKLVYDIHEPFHQQQPVEEPIPVAAVYGASLLIPMRIIEEHGFLDENFFLYHEETDYCYRLARHGIPSFLVPASRITHIAQGSAANSSRLKIVMNYYWHRNRYIMLRRYQGWFPYLKRMIQPYFFLLLTKWLRGHFRQPIQEDVTFGQYVYFCAWCDALLGRMGKTFAPEDYVSTFGMKEETMRLCTE